VYGTTDLISYSNTVRYIASRALKRPQRVLRRRRARESASSPHSDPPSRLTRHRHSVLILQYAVEDEVVRIDSSVYTEHTPRRLTVDPPDAGRDPSHAATRSAYDTVECVEYERCSVSSTSAVEYFTLRLHNSTATPRALRHETTGDSALTSCQTTRQATDRPNSNQLHAHTVRTCTRQAPQTTHDGVSDHRREGRRAVRRTARRPSAYTMPRSWPRSSPECGHHGPVSTRAPVGANCVARL
jgi:hypothetical protein